MGLFHDASPTWSGFNYQGKLALYHSLKIMNSIPELEYGSYELELEWFEDFAIKKDGKYKTIHQVKAYNTSSISKYNDAIWGLAKRLLKHTYLNNVYLHTWKEVDCDWKDSVIEIVENNLNEGDPKINEIKNILSDEKKLSEFHRNMCTVKRGAKSNMEKLINELLGEEYKNLERQDFKDKLQESIDKYKSDIGKYLSIYISNKAIIKKINQYDYDGNKFCELTEISAKIKNELKKYFLLNSRQYDIENEEYIENIYLHLLGLIDENIMHRHNEYNSNSYEKLSISFRDIEQKLLIKQELSETYYLYKLKEYIYDKAILKCKRCKLENCSKCNINKATNHINSLNKVDFREFCIILSPEVVINNKINVHEYKNLIPREALNKFFNALKFIENGWKYNKHISHDEDKLLTTLINDDVDDDENHEIIVEKIFENKNIHEALMEYSMILSHNVDIDNIGEINPNIGKISDYDLDLIEEEETKYNINNIKNITIKSINKYMEEVNVRSN